MHSKTGVCQRINFTIAGDKKRQVAIDLAYEIKACSLFFECDRYLSVGFFAHTLSKDKWMVAQFKVNKASFVRGHWLKRLLAT